MRSILFLIIVLKVSVNPLYYIFLGIKYTLYRKNINKSNWENDLQNIFLRTWKTKPFWQTVALISKRYCT